jgi:hypothetical protein
VCEGYANNPGSGRSEPVRFVVYAPPNPVPLLSEHPDLDWSERRALSYFQDRTALELAGAFQTDFWMAHILPLSRQERSVRHAIIALSSMHEHYSGVDHYSPTRGVDFALEHYGKAMREVVRFSQYHPDQSFEFALVTCALFSTFESLQGQYHEACNHAVAGIKILAEEQHRLLNGELRTRIPREALTRFFIALGRQIFELGDPNFPGTKPDLFFTRTTISMPEQFDSYEIALLHMEVLLGELFEYIERADSAAKQGIISEELALSLMTEFHSIKMSFEKWKVAFESFSAVDSNEFSRETPESMSSASSSASSPTADQSRSPRNPAFLILKVYHSLILAYMERIEKNDESVFTDFEPDVWTALDATEEFLQTTSTYVQPLDKTSPTRSPTDPTSIPPHPHIPPAIRPTFSLALGVVPTLFLIATRSSTPAQYDKALHLLRTCNRREGLWDSNLAAKIVERVRLLRDFAARMAIPPDSPFDVNVLSSDLQAVHIREPVRTAPPGTALDKFSNVNPDSKGVDFKLLDIKFLPGRKCIMRYTFIRVVEGQAPRTIPSISDEMGLLPATRQYQGDFWEEISWDE